MSENVVEDLARKRLGRTIKGKWRLDRLIGVGGMAAVYAATHRNGARVAIKMLHATISASQQIRARFIREGYLANKVDHPGVVRVLDDDVDDTDQSAFLVMDLVVGTTLAERAMERLLDAGEVLDVAEQVLQVLHAAHEKSIVHRDLKPDNLLVDSVGKVHVLDFGIARLLDDVTGGVSSTKTGTAFGTPGFMAPEQALGKTAQISARTDLYALGATLFALVCGDFVHAAENPQELLVLVATQPARSLGEMAPGMAAEVVHIIDKSTRNAPEERWQSAAEMLAAVRAAKEKLGVTHVKVLPLNAHGLTPPPGDLAPYRRTPNDETHNSTPPVFAPPERNSHPDPVAYAPNDPPSGIGPAPFTVQSDSALQVQRKPRFLPLAIIGGVAAVIAVVALMARRQEPKPAANQPAAVEEAKPTKTAEVATTAVPTAVETASVAAPSTTVAPPTTTGAKVLSPKFAPPIKSTGTKPSASTKKPGIDVGY
jgi:eukaryotic-like serine/threonine-protein kinase